MRLTLRTMLAYMDEILDDPADVEELGKKIEASPFASSLLHRIRDCMRRLRLNTPPLEGRGLGRDPNSVAEYLDNTLPQDRVPDLEKVCLESDVHLAEVASCHQILALVHSEHREVPLALRRRVYGLKRPETPVSRQAASARGAEGNGNSPAGAEPASSTSASSTPASAGPTAAADGRMSAATAGQSVPDSAGAGHEGSGREGPGREGPGSERKLEVPEYLRDAAPRRSPVVPVLATLLVAFLLATVALLAMGPLDAEHPVLGWMARDAVEPPPERADGPGGEQVAAKKTEGDEAVAVDGEQGRSDAAASSDAGADRTTREPPDAGAGPENADADAGPADADAGPAGTGPDNAEPARSPVPPELDPEAAEAGPGDEVPPSVPGAGEPARQPAEPMPGQPDRVARVPSVPVLPGEPGLPPRADPAGPLLPPGVSPPGVSPPAVSPPDGDAAEPPPAKGPVMDVGRFISETQVLLRYEQDHWVRVPANGRLFSDDELQVLPTYRPQLVLATGIKITFAGDAAVRLGAIEPAEVSRLTMRSGRALILRVGQAGARLRLDFAGRPGMLVLHDADSAVAVELRRYLPPGSDPQSDPAVDVAQLFVVSGRVGWREDPAEETEVALQPGQVGVLIGGNPLRPERFETAPEWIDPRGGLSPIDREASLTMEPLVESGRAARLTLLELTEHRQTEIRALAARCLGSLEQYEPLVDQLGDPRQRSYWDDVFHALRDGVARGPQSAARIQQAFQRKHPQEAEILYRLAWGFSPQQLAAGGAGDLVNYLEHPSMPVRILAYQNLKQITGGVTHLFRPEKDVDEERGKVLRWRERLAEGAIRYQTLPEPTPARPAATPPATP